MEREYYVLCTLVITERHVAHVLGGQREIRSGLSYIYHDFLLLKFLFGRPLSLSLPFFANLGVSSEVLAGEPHGLHQAWY